MKLRLRWDRKGARRRVLPLLVPGLSAVLAGAGLWCSPSLMFGQSGAQNNAQSSAPAPSAQQSDNPFPGEPKAEPANGTGQKPDPVAGAKPGQAPASGPGAAGTPGTAGTSGAPGKSDNPFPGEDTNAPIIPIGPVGGADSGAGSGRRTDGTGAPDLDGDPVRSPDGQGSGVGNGSGDGSGDDGFSSSRSGVGNAPEDNGRDAKPGKAVKIKTRAERLKEDLDVGSFYLDRKNWKAAQDRFASAFLLDAENEDAVYGLAEAEQRLELYDKAREHYELFLSYDPDGPHSKAARRALEQVESARAKTVGPARGGDSKTLPD